MHAKRNIIGPVNSGNAGRAELEAMFAAGYSARAVERYYDHGDAERRIYSEQIGEAYARIRMGLPPRDQYELARYSEWAVRIGMSVSPAALGPGGPERKAGFLAAATKREEQFEASRAWTDSVVGEPAPLLYPEDPVAQHRSHEAVARLENQLPPRDDFECETYRRWAETDPRARHARESAIDRKQDWQPSRWEIAMLAEVCGPSEQTREPTGGAEREAEELVRIRTAQLEDLEEDLVIEPPF